MTTDSIFTQIIQGKLPGHFVWQDELSVAIMTIQPINPGHILLIPREQIDHWDDLPEELINHLLKVSKILSHALKTIFKPERIGLVIAGLEVPHTHIHLFPANKLADFDFSRAKPANDVALKRLTAIICQTLEATKF